MGNSDAGGYVWTRGGRTATVCFRSLSEKTVYEAIVFKFRYSLFWLFLHYCCVRIILDDYSKTPRYDHGSGKRIGRYERDGCNA